MQFIAKVKVFSMEVKAKCCLHVGKEEHNIVILFDLRHWLASRSCKVFASKGYAVDF